MKQNKDVALKEAILNDNLDIVFNKARLEATLEDTLLDGKTKKK